MHWTLGLDDFVAGKIGALEAAFNIALRGGLPILGTIALGVWISWKYGRLYCGWLCPHFSVVETVNQLMRRTIGRQSLWDRHPLPERNADGSITRADPRYWLLLLPLVIAFAFVWAVALLTYHQTDPSASTASGFAMCTFFDYFIILAGQEAELTDIYFTTAPDQREIFKVGDQVEVYCDRENDQGARVRDWLIGTVVQVDPKMIAVQFQENVYLTDGWMVPDHVLWCPKNSANIRRAQIHKRRPRPRAK